MVIEELLCEPNRYDYGAVVEWLLRSFSVNQIGMIMEQW
jgi:hypothetical protein